MKRLVKILILIIVFFGICAKIVCLVYPVEILEVKCRDITGNLDYYILNDNIDLTKKIEANPTSYLVVYYDIHIKNNNDNEVFVENYKYKIPYANIYFEERVEFYDQYELKSGENENLCGIYIIDIAERNRDEAMSNIKNKSEVNIYYWVYLYKIPLFSWIKK